MLKEVYISCKWSEHLFIEKVEKTKEALTEELLAAVRSADLAAAARLVAQRADVTAVVPGDARQRHMLHGTPWALEAVAADASVRQMCVFVWGCVRV